MARTATLYETNGDALYVQLSDEPDVLLGGGQDSPHRFQEDAAALFAQGIACWQGPVYRETRRPEGEAESWWWIGDAEAEPFRLDLEDAVEHVATFTDRKRFICLRGTQLGEAAHRYIYQRRA